MRFTKIDLSQVYHQLQLTPESRKYTTINTYQGLYQYKRLTYGVTSAVSIFQRTIENVLKGLPGCCVRIDDILVSGETDEIHLENLYRVLQRLQVCGLKLNPNKFHFMLDQVVHLGTTISAEGISPTKERLKAIREAEAPNQCAGTAVLPRKCKLPSQICARFCKNCLILIPVTL